VFVVEQNRDAQMKSLLLRKRGRRPVASILHYDGMPIPGECGSRALSAR
jgi:hypothetical protein